MVMLLAARENHCRVAPGELFPSLCPITYELPIVLSYTNKLFAPLHDTARYSILHPPARAFHL
jgi:hypothetical protein